MLNPIDQIIRENFDISDNHTRNCIVALEDAEQSQLLTALSSALYDKIVQKVDQIDFGSIPNSRGDITKVEGFDNTVECLNIIRKLVIEYKENPEIVDTVLVAIENIKNRKGVFMKAYSLNIEFPMVLYNLIVMAIEQSVSFLIAVCIQYIKDPATQGVASALDKVAYKNTRDNLLYEQLAKFNVSCTNKELDIALNDVMKNGGKIAEAMEYMEKENQVCPECGASPCTCNVRSPFQEFPEEVKNDDCIVKPDNGQEPIHELDPVEGGESITSEEEPVSEIGVSTIVGAAGIAAVAGTGLVLGLKSIQVLIKIMIPIMRSVTYFTINSVVKFSDCLTVQAQFIEANAYKLQYSTTSNLDDSKKEKVIARQLKVANKLKAIANKFMINDKKATKAARDLAAEEAKKMKVEDLKHELPSDIYDKGLLF